MLHPAHRVGPIAAFEPLYLALAQLQHSQSPSLAETLSDSSPPSLEGDRISLQLGGDIILEHLHVFHALVLLQRENVVLTATRFCHPYRLSNGCQSRAAGEVVDAGHLG